LRRDPERLGGDDAALRALAERYGLKMVIDGPTIDGSITEGLDHVADRARARRLGEDLIPRREPG
jgi:hypothetical protein